MKKMQFDKLIINNNNNNNQNEENKNNNNKEIIDIPLEKDNSAKNISPLLIQIEIINLMINYWNLRRLNQKNYKNQLWMKY